MTLTIQQICRAHDRNNFDCGNEEINRFFRTTARRNDERNLIRVHVLVDDACPDHVLGFYALTPKELKAPPESGLKKYDQPVPVMLLAKMGVDKDHHRQGLGSHLVISAIKDVVEISRRTGLVGLFVDPKDAVAETLYEGLDFQRVKSGSPQLWLPIQECRAVIQGEE